MKLSKTTLEWGFITLVFFAVLSLSFLSTEMDTRTAASGALIVALPSTLTYLFGKSRPDSK